MTKARRRSSQAPARRDAPPASSASFSFSREERYASILPPVEQVERFDDLVDNGAERIFIQFEQQSAHRRALERMDMQANIRLAWAGVACAFSIAMTFVIGGMVLVATGHGAYGSLFGGVGVASIIGAFIFGTQRKGQELARKFRILRGESPD